MSDTVLVTGGSGFIGAWVLRELVTQGRTPVVFDVSLHRERQQRILGSAASQIVFAEGSLLDSGCLGKVCDEHHVTHLIHLAAILTPACQKDPLMGCQVNVVGSVEVFETVRRRADRIRGLSYASSLGIFGPEPDEVGEALPDAPTRANQPPTFYGVFKKAVEMIAAGYWQHFGIASVGLRPHVVYGPERDVGLTAGPSLAARAAVGGESYVIPYTGRAGYDYVEDVARAFVDAALETPPGAFVADLDGEEATPEEIVALINEVVPGTAKRLAVSGPAIPSNIPPRKSLISALFPKWHATSLREGIRKTVAFYQTARGGESQPGESRR